MVVVIDADDVPAWLRRRAVEKTMRTAATMWRSGFWSDIRVALDEEDASRWRRRVLTRGGWRGELSRGKREGDMATTPGETCSRGERW